VIKGGGVGSPCLTPESQTGGHILGTVIDTHRGLPLLPGVNPEPHTINPKPKTPNPKPYTPNPQPETLNRTSSSRTVHPKSCTPNPKPYTLSPQPEILNCAPYTPSPKPCTLRPQRETLKRTPASRYVGNDGGPCLPCDAGQSFFFFFITLEPRVE